MLEAAVRGIYGHDITSDYRRVTLNTDIAQKLTPSRSHHSGPFIFASTGFTANGQIVSGKRGEWSVYLREDSTLPILSGGETNIYAMGALYQDNKNPLKKTAVLRLSQERLSRDDYLGFLEDLKTLTKHFTERPKIFGIPSKVMEAPLTYFALGIGSALAVATAYSVMQSQEHETQASWASIGILASIGTGLGVPPLSLLLYSALNRGFHKKIKQMDGYYVGGDALNALRSERTHTIDATIQRWLVNQSPGLQSPQELTPQLVQNVKKIIKPQLNTLGVMSLTPNKLMRSVETLLTPAVYSTLRNSGSPATA